MAIKENSVEEDIINAQHFINSIKTDKDYKDENGWHGYYNREIVELVRILDHILSDYKRVLKENNRLEEQVEYDKTHIYTPQTIELNFISKSKIEDKIKKLNDVSNAEELEDIMNRKNYTIVELVQYVLQELLERRK